MINNLHKEGEISDFLVKVLNGEKVTQPFTEKDVEVVGDLMKKMDIYSGELEK